MDHPQKPTPAKKKPEPHPLEAAWCATVAAWRGNGTVVRLDSKADRAALRTLDGYPEATPDELTKRAKWALEQPWFAKCPTLATFVGRWSSWTERDVTRGHVPVESGKWEPIDFTKYPKAGPLFPGPGEEGSE